MEVHCCPVCGGRGMVPGGFYVTNPLSDSTEPETCRTCNGEGVLWSGCASPCPMPQWPRYEEYPQHTTVAPPEGRHPHIRLGPPPWLRDSTATLPEDAKEWDDA